MLDDKEKKTDEKVDAKPASDEKKKSQTEKETNCLHKLTQIFKSAEDVIDEMLVEGSTPSIAILGLLITSFYENMQNKMIVVLKRDPTFKAISDRIDAEHEAKSKKEAAE
jgi:hypothetical protein